MTDPISNILTSIRNALLLNYKNVVVSHSKTIESIVLLLSNIGYIKNFKIIQKKFFKSILIFLKYNFDGKSIIHGIKRISKPSLRKYCNRRNIPLVCNGLGTAILSTSRGIITSYKAKKIGVGGEIICIIW